VVNFAPGLICDLWKLWLPDFRVEFHAARKDWERGRLESAHERLKPGMRVWDIGAEHGDFTALYRLWGADVVPIEPSAPYWPCIRQTYEANALEAIPPSAWFNGFAADVTRRGPDDCGTGTWPECSNGEVVADYCFRHLAQDSETPRIKLDDLAELTGPPDALMIDVEGAEHAVLSGARHVLAAGDVLVWVSVHEPTMLDWYGRTLENLHALMASVDYSGTLLPEHGEAETFWLYERTP
jgi:FkbM family methyltransferase